MVQALANLIAAFGLSASAGLNAYIPLLVVALAARYTPWLQLSDPFHHLTNGWVIAALVVLLLIEFFADKAPAVNHLNDLIQTFVRPAAGALLFAASANVVSDMSPVAAIIAGLLVAGSVHTVKSAAVRPAVTATTGGTANPIVSLVEDMIAALLSIFAVVLPVFLSALIVLVTALVIWWAWRWSNRRQHAGV